MSKVVSAREAVNIIENGDCVGINAFMALANPEALDDAIYSRFVETGAPRDLRLFCAATFGHMAENRGAGRYIKAGAVREIIQGHWISTPEAHKMAVAGEIEAYCLPMGVLAQAVRAAASGKEWMLSKIGLDIYCDPRIDTCALNDISKKELVQVHEAGGKEYLLYSTPKIDVALIKGTSADQHGNISFEDEYYIGDALAMAQAVKCRGGKVIVQVERVFKRHTHTETVIIPGILVDYIVIAETKPWSSPKPRACPEGVAAGEQDRSADIICERAAQEFRPGQVVNFGYGIPEVISKYAMQRGIFEDITLTVESGGIGGYPSEDYSFGAMDDADFISDMAAQFDFYDGGGLDICFMGGLEADMHGNVNAHKQNGRYNGIGGFGNVTFSTKTIIFCMTFNAKGLVAVKEDGVVKILSEGTIPKFNRNIAAISFSGKKALEHGQRILFVTERCVFELTDAGLRLKEVFDGIDEQTQIRDLLDFEV